MSWEEYWIGKDVDFRGVWRDYEKGLLYIEKFHTMQVYLIRFTFDQPPSNLPLFNHEAIYKTIKGYFHELKLKCLSRREYEVAGPLFLYEIRRRSSVWGFLSELRQLLLLGTTLADQKIIGQKLDNTDKKLSILKKYFGEAVNPEDFQKFMAAETPKEIDFALQKLFENGLKKVEISKQPFTGNIEETEAQLVDIKGLLQQAQQE